MNKGHVTVFSAVAIAVILFNGILFASPGGAPRPFTLLEQSADGLSLRYLPAPRLRHVVSIEGDLHVVYEGAAFEALIGDPQLPADVVSVGVPDGSRVEIELRDAVYTDAPGVPVAPVPSYQANSDNEALPQYHKNPQAYTRNAFVPARTAVVGHAFSVRGQRICPIMVAPLQFNPVTRSMRTLVAATLRVRFVRTGGSGASRVAPVSGDRFFENVFKGLIINYTQARQWRDASRSAVTAAKQDSTRSWFVTGRQYVRIPIVADGWYRLSSADLLAAGINPSSVDRPTMALLSRGMNVPFLSGPDSSIGFSADRNRGDTTYYDFFSDTNVCWLTWGGASGKRYVGAPQPAGTPVATLRSTLVRVHVEQNNGFYVGTTTDELGQNTPVPGRGWYWENYYPQTVIAHPFTLDMIDASAYPTAMVRIRLFSTTTGASPNNHKAKFWLNDSLVGQVYFAGRAGVTYAVTVPASWLKEGANSLTIKSDTTTAQANQFYLDWFEIDYGRLLVATGDQTRFTVTSPASGLYAITVRGFTTPSISVYDPTSGRTITGGAVGGDSLGGFGITFSDTVSSARTYVAVSGDGGLPVPGMSSKSFQDIRVNSLGADYIIITHRDFIPAARQLAAHRASFNHVRTSVVDVQDIYDEFNYGVMNGDRIKDFLRFTYQNWMAPQPAYVLMFGGASWDYHRYLPTTIKTNYVPAHGVPAGDNWFVSFSAGPDSGSFASMFIGRLPVQDPAQAQAIVAKVIGYDTTPLGDWNKNFLYITGGDTPSEQYTFNLLSDTSISRYVDRPPMGGTAFRVYKSGPAVIDGGSKQFMKDLVTDGLVFINFLGHSGGRIWGVDIGPPDELENTNGKLPFVSSVSCNVGAFAEPSNNVLSEDFVLAPNRGAVAMWASSALGYPFQGSQLVDYLLEEAVKDSLRDFGSLTTLARMRLWQGSPNNISQSDLNLTPLLGDPLSTFGVPLKPDLAIDPGDITLNKTSPTASDSALVLRLGVHNYGLVPTDSLTVQVTDIYNGRSSVIPVDGRVRPPLHEDSMFVAWVAADQPGRHTVTVSLDPAGAIDEIDRSNNVASTDLYVYANALLALKPLRNQQVPSGMQTLVVSTPLGGDSASYQYVFELDTVSTFDSPFKVSSPSIVPGNVSGQWTTPALAPKQVYFWRARTVVGSTLGRWVVSSFATAQNLPVNPIVRVRESTVRQFRQEVLTQTVETDSGVVIAPRPPLFLYARSLGYRASTDKDYYSILRLNDMVVTGYWWHLGGSFMVLRVNEFTGGFNFQAFDVGAHPELADSMKSFIQKTPVGNYIAISVIFDGATNVSDSLKAAIGSLGSTMVGSVTPGQSWALIGRKGYPASALESLTNDSAVVSLQIPNFFSFGIGWMTSGALPMPAAWHHLHWSAQMVPGKTDGLLSILGIRGNGQVDTLRTFTRDSTDIDISSLTALTSDSAYQSFRVAVVLTTTDALVTPQLKEWSLEFEPAGDLAISKSTVGLPDFSTRKGSTFQLPVTVYNIGYRRIDTTSVSVQVYDHQNVLHPIAAGTLGPVEAGSSQSGFVGIPTTYLSGRPVLRVSVGARRSKELSLDNNAADYAFAVTGDQASELQFYSDGIRIMDGDYISPAPTILIHLPAETGTPPGPREVDLYVDEMQAGSVSGAANRAARVSGVNSDPVFSPILSDGRHSLRVHVSQPNLLGEIDSLDQRVTVNVMSETRILQVLNYPNPFTSETSFTFILTGARPPEEVIIRVFTIAGRKIRELSVLQGSLQIGFNRIPWDGRDNDGDQIANGYYLYQVQAKSEGKTIFEKGKLARIR